MTPILWIRAGIVLLAFIAGAYLSHLYYSPRLERAQTEAAQTKASYAAISAAAEKQSKEIEAIKQAQIVRDNEAQKAVAKAKADAMLAYGDAAKIMRQPAPVGLNLCEAARAAFDNELREERGK